MNEQEVYLPKEDPSAFEILVHWIYRKTLPTYLQGCLTTVSEVANYAELYRLAQKLEMTSLQRSVHSTTNSEPINFISYNVLAFGPPSRSPFKRMTEAQ